MTDETNKPDEIEQPATAEDPGSAALEQEVVALEAALTEEPAPAPAPKPPSWFHVWVIAPLKRSHWVFRIGDFITYRLQLQDHQQQEFAEMKGAMLMMATQQRQLAGFLRDVRQRLMHHENGPLQASKRELDRRRGDGMVRPLEAKRNGGRKIMTLDKDIVTPAPAALICVHGRMRSACGECFPTKA